MKQEAQLSVENGASAAFENLAFVTKKAMLMPYNKKISLFHTVVSDLY